MPPISLHQSANTTKLLLLGDSGSGKTGALPSLAQAGYNLRILDLDNGLDIVKNLLLDPSAPYGKEAASRVHYITVTEKMRFVAGKSVPATATVWTRCMNILNEWKDGDDNFGHISTWSPKDILVIDSLTFLGAAAMNHILALNGRLGQSPYQGDWGEAQRLLENLLQMLYSTEIKCNVIICCHIKSMGETITEADGKVIRDVGQKKGYPNALGRDLPRRVAQYFNSALLVTARGSGANVKRTILTTTNGMIDLKNSNPIKIKPELPHATGLAEFFSILNGKVTP